MTDATSEQEPTPIHRKVFFGMLKRKNTVDKFNPDQAIKGVGDQLMAVAGSLRAIQRGCITRESNIQMHEMACRLETLGNEMNLQGYHRGSLMRGDREALLRRNVAQVIASLQTVFSISNNGVKAINEFADWFYLNDPSLPQPSLSKFVKTDDQHEPPDRPTR